MLILENRYEMRKDLKRKLSFLKLRNKKVGGMLHIDCEKMQLSYIPQNLSEWADRHENTKITSKANSQNQNVINWLF